MYDDSETPTVEFYGVKTTPLSTVTSQINKGEVKTYKNIAFTFKEAVFDDIQEGKSTYALVTVPQSTINGCQAASTTPIDWSITYTLYDGMNTNTGESFVPNYNQITLDPVTDADQSKTYSFKVICSPTYAGLQSTGIANCAIGINTAPCWCGDPSAQQLTRVNNCGSG